MAFDACMMRAVLSDVWQRFPDAKIEKVLQPQNDEIDLVIHSGRDTGRLVFNAGPNAPRIQLTSIAKENPLKAPTFCMFLRKHLLGARIVGIEQPGFDRIAVFTLSCYDEMGFAVKRKLICEIMGKYANLVFCDEDLKIISALKFIDFSQSTVRQIIPGLRYTLPEPQKKTPAIEFSEQAFYKALAEYPKEKTAEKFIVGAFGGIATQISREIVYRASGDNDLPMSEIDTEKLKNVMLSWHKTLISGDYTPTVALDSEGKPIDYSYMDITYLEGGARINHFDSLSDLLDSYFSEKDRLEKIRQRGRDLITLISNAISRTERKLGLQRESLLESERGEDYKRNGDLITSNIYKITRGMDKVLCVDYYDESCPEIEITLDTRLSPAQNAQRYYKLYNKAKKAKEILTEQIKIWEGELIYLDSVRAFLDKAVIEEDINELREELYRSGYSSKMKNYLPQKKVRLTPMQYKTSGGYTLLVGKNNIQNDNLTFKIADKGDIWFHVKDMPGSHVIMQTEGKEPSEIDYTEAAEIAAYYSKATAGPVAVDYTKVKNIKKPAGAKPGFVIYKTNFTAYVSPKNPENKENG
ncbi:MAG: NFACT family protein [Clostridia bacterium]|nr:NFACT family protein [Clostridia bacterium]